ncbi:hypothetical protein FOXG_15971 [Fusarium oxysporum f. sp. lycopersici 4287]|uniref:Uncharacterized protein n=2 Tax=Fusarium oxysporum TaxID=5507 RepID=A0A0J9WUR9_FUSO4|nr:uncharacterized protein FOXG_15971 [Fusarium oxysporum f. sp. lycopersici 4287]KNB18262.1 hypothetical protein FOXG_15971 [Fusarium oxysporum f. sp. lycopersici 4287]
MHIEGNGPPEREITVQETTSTSCQTPPELINPVNRSVSLPADSSIPASFLAESQNFLKSWRREKGRLAMATKTFEQKATKLSTLEDELTLVRQRLQKSEETVRELRKQIKESGDTETLHNDIRDLIAKLPPAEGSNFHSKWLSKLRSNAEMINDSMLAESKSLPKRLSNAESELDGTRKRITQLEGQIQLRRNGPRGNSEMTGQAPSQAGPSVSISEPCSISDPNKTIDDITEKLSVYLAAKHSPPFTAPAGFDDALNGLASPNRIVQVFQTELRKAGIYGFPPRPLKRPRGQFLEDPDDPAQVAKRLRPNNTIPGTPRIDITTPVSHPAAGQPTQELHSLDHISQPMLKVNPPDGYEWPDARRIPSVFFPELGDMIARNGHKASIFALFPPDAAKCRLLLNIEAAKVSPLVMRLYGIQIVEIEEQRAFALPGGVNAIISGSAQFTNTKLSLWDELFGDLIIQGVRNSRGYLDEVARGIMLSECVSMEVPSATDHPAKITITINEFALNDVITRLWLS